jgi:hypothetical protein
MQIERPCRLLIQRTLEDELNLYNRVDVFASNFGGIPLRDTIYRGNIAGGYRIWTGSNGLAVHIRGISVGQHDGFPIIKQTSPITPVPQYISSRLVSGNTITTQSSRNSRAMQYAVVSAERRIYSSVDMESFFCVMFRDKLR